MELIAAMESILPVKTLLKFYKAFRAADPAHALVQVWAYRAMRKLSLEPCYGGEAPCVSVWARLGLVGVGFIVFDGKVARSPEAVENRTDSMAWLGWAQCVEIMSDDQSMLLKRHGSGESTAFEYRPKVSASLKLPPLPVFKRVVCRAT